MEGGLDTVVGHQVNDEGFFVPDFSAHIATESVRCVYVRRAEYVKARDGVRQDEVSARNDLDELCSLSLSGSRRRERDPLDRTKFEPLSTHETVSSTLSRLINRPLPSANQDRAAPNGA